MVSNRESVLDLCGGMKFCFPLELSRGIRPRLECKQRTPLSSQVVTGNSWSPLTGLKGVKPPVEF